MSILDAKVENWERWVRENGKEVVSLVRQKRRQELHAERISHSQQGVTNQPNGATSKATKHQCCSKGHGLYHHINISGREVQDEEQDGFQWGKASHLLFRVQQPREEVLLLLASGPELAPTFQQQGPEWEPAQGLGHSSTLGRTSSQGGAGPEGTSPRLEEQGGQLRQAHEGGGQGVGEVVGGEE